MKILDDIKGYFDKKRKLHFAKKTWLGFTGDLFRKYRDNPANSYYSERLMDAIISAQYILLEYKDDNKMFSTPLFDDHYFSFRELMPNGTVNVTLYEPTVAEYVKVFERVNTWKIERFKGLSVSTYESVSRHDYSIVTQRATTVGELFYLLEQLRIFVKRVDEELGRYGTTIDPSISVVVSTVIKIIKGLQTVIR